MRKCHYEVLKILLIHHNVRLCQLFTDFSLRLVRQIVIHFLEISTVALILTLL